MSISNEVMFEHRMPGLPHGGRFVTYDWGCMFDELQVDHQGKLWMRPGAVWGMKAGEWKATSWSGELALQGGQEGGDYTALFHDGLLSGVRPGYRTPWQHKAVSPGGPWQPVLVYDIMYGMEQPPLSDLTRALEGRIMQASGLPDAAGGGSWAIARSGDLFLLRGEISEEKMAQGMVDADPHPFHGWVFLRDSQGVLPDQAMRFAAGRQQWMVLVEEDGSALAPRTLSGVWPPRNGSLDSRHASLQAACRILPTDYTEYGGDAVRWELPEDGDPDCSCGCRWFVPLHDPAHGGGPDGDWGVCANAASPRCGLLTWEHQAGRGCFESEEAGGSVLV
jgi:hypothetical protein